MHVRHYMTNAFRNRHRRSVPSISGMIRVSRVQEAGDPVVIADTNRGLPNWRPVRPQRPVHFASPLRPDANSTQTLRLQTYDWAMTISGCSATCGGGQQTISIYCHAGPFVVDAVYCDQQRQPARNGTRSCNTHACRGR